jgi:hypothetical protein
MQLLQQSEATAERRRIFVYLVDATDNETPETAIAIAAGELQLSKNGAAFADGAGTFTHVGAGIYRYEATAGELDTVGVLIMKIVDAAANISITYAQVVPWDPYSSDFATAGALANVQTDIDSIQTATPALRTVGPVSMGALAANGASQAISALQAYETIVTVNGTFGSGSAQVQVCENPTAVSPVWTNSGSALTANGSVTVSGPHAGVRVSLSGATSPALTVTALQRVPAG